MERREGAEYAVGRIRELRDEFWRDVKVTGTNEDFNQTASGGPAAWPTCSGWASSCASTLHRRESCGGHFRAESQTEDGEALRHDDQYLYVGAPGSGATVASRSSTRSR